MVCAGSSRYGDVVSAKWRATLRASLVAALSITCGPAAPAEPEAAGVLEYDGYGVRLYRLGRRVDAFVQGEGDVEHHECGMMSERAHDELEDVLATLDPAVELGCDPETSNRSPEARIHVAGFEHSPFACGNPITIVGFDEPPYVCEPVCCRPGLEGAVRIYQLVAFYFAQSKEPLEVDGEPYVAIEPDEPCPPVEGGGS